MVLKMYEHGSRPHQIGEAPNSVLLSLPPGITVLWDVVCLKCILIDLSLNIYTAVT